VDQQQKEFPMTGLKAKQMQKLIGGYAVTPNYSRSRKYYVDRTASDLMIKLMAK
jgi:hypothetical protein